MKKKQNEAIRRQEDLALSRGLYWVCGAVVLEALLLLLKRYYVDYQLSTGVDLMLAIHNALGVGRIVAVAAAIGCLVWALFQRKGNKSAVLPMVLAIAAGALAVCAHVAVRYNDSGIRMLFLMVAGWGALALAFYLYQREFFLAAVGSGLGVAGLWFARFGGGICLETLGTLVAILLVLVVAVVLKKADGAVKLAGVEIQFMPKGSSYNLILASALAALVALAAACLLGSAVAYYLIFLMIAWLFGLLVYYTVKMM